jgi:hypothetical protein
VTAYAGLPLGDEVVSTDQLQIVTEDPPEAGMNKPSILYRLPLGNADCQDL